MLHPFCNRCGWRKGGVDSWNGRACKCGHSDSPMRELTDDEMGKTAGVGAPAGDADRHPGGTVGLVGGVSAGELPAHDFDDDCVCRRCSFDGAEWWHLERMKPNQDREPEPSCPVTFS